MEKKGIICPYCKKTIYEDEIKARVKEDTFRKVTTIEADADDRKERVKQLMGK